MPQMSPMNWFMLFFYFNICFFVCLNKIYYLSLVKITKESVSSKSYTNYNFTI